MTGQGYRKPTAAAAGEFSKVLEGYEKIKAMQAGVERDYRNLSNLDLALGTGFFGMAKSSLKSAVARKAEMPEAARKLLDANSACFAAFTEVGKANEKLRASPSDVFAAADYAAASMEYMRKLYELEALVQHFEQSNQKGKKLINSINFALDAVTVPLLALGAASLVDAGVKEGFQQVAKAALRNIAKAEVIAASSGYAAFMTSGDYCGMKDLDIAAKRYRTDREGATKSLRSSLKEMRLKSAELGMKNLTGQIVKMELDLYDLSPEIKTEKSNIDEARLAGRFAMYFAAAMVVSAVLSTGGMAQKSAEGMIEVDITHVHSTWASSRAQSLPKLDLGWLGKAAGISTRKSKAPTKGRGSEVRYTHTLTFKSVNDYQNALPKIREISGKGYTVSEPRMKKTPLEKDVAETGTGSMTKAINQVKTSLPPKDYKGAVSVDITYPGSSIKHTQIYPNAKKYIEEGIPYLVEQVRIHRATVSKPDWSAPRE